MADAVDAHEAAQAPPTSKAAGPPSMPAVSIDETPMEPATSPRTRTVPFYVEELRLPTREIGPQDEPEKLVTRWLVNDGSYTDEEFDALLRKARQAFNNYDMDLETEDAVRREREEYDRSVKEWERRIAARNLSDHRDTPRGPPPAGTSSMRALPDGHAALRQSDPSMAAQFTTSRQEGSAIYGKADATSLLFRQGTSKDWYSNCSLHHQRHHVQMQLKA